MSGLLYHTLQQGMIVTVARTADFRLYNCDAIAGLKCVKSNSIDAVISDPPYAEINRKYGRLTEPQWHDLMDGVVTESMRVLKPKGSAMFVLQPYYDCIGKMRLWVWEFLVRTAKKWNLIQNAYWHNPCATPTAGTNRVQGLMRPSVKYCLWFGDSSCNRYQGSVLKEIGKFDIRRLKSTEVKKSPSGTSIRDSSAFLAASERGGSTPFNLLTLTKADFKFSYRMFWTEQCRALRA